MEDCAGDEYSVSALDSDELESWFDFLAAAFAEKGTPREYFVRHVTNDPWFDVSSIFVAKREGKICSTTRIFYRRIFLDGHVVPMAGLGEVCTLTAYRRAGLVSKVLKMITDYIKERKFPLSFLHSSRPSIQGIYKRRGWVNVPVGYGLYDVNISDVTRLVEGLGVEAVRMDLKERDHCRALMKLYNGMAASFSGLVVRDDEEYWTKWIYEECTQHQCVCYALNYEDSNKGFSQAVSAYLICHKLPTGGVGVLEYLYDQQHFSGDITPKQAFLVILCQAVSALKLDDTVYCNVTSPLSFVPRDWLDDTSYSRFRQISVDMGCMYQIMDVSKTEQPLKAIETYCSDATYSSHVFSKLDMF